MAFGSARYGTPPTATAHMLLTSTSRDRVALERLTPTESTKDTQRSNRQTTSQHLAAHTTETHTHQSPPRQRQRRCPARPCPPPASALRTPRLLAARPPHTQHRLQHRLLAWCHNRAQRINTTTRSEVGVGFRGSVSERHGLPECASNDTQRNVHPMPFEEGEPRINPDIEHPPYADKSRLSKARTISLSKTNAPSPRSSSSPQNYKKDRDIDMR